MASRGYDYPTELEPDGLDLSGGGNSSLATEASTSGGTHPLLAASKGNYIEDGKVVHVPGGTHCLIELDPEHKMALLIRPHANLPAIMTLRDTVAYATAFRVGDASSKSRSVPSNAPLEDEEGVMIYKWSKRLKITSATHGRYFFQITVQPRSEQRRHEVLAVFHTSYIEMTEWF